jgi:hypothetical protein
VLVVVLGPGAPGHDDHRLEASGVGSADVSRHSSHRSDNVGRYTAPTPDEVIAPVLAYHERQRTERAKPPAPPPSYRPEVLATLFGARAADGRTQ